MAIQASYKKFKRGQRQANVETDFSKGMMFSEGAVSEGYVKTLVNFDFTQDGRKALKPRAALQTCEVIVPDMVTSLVDESDFISSDTLIKYSKECVENGVGYRQFILGKPSIDNDGQPEDTGTIWVLTSAQTKNGTDEDINVSGSDICLSSETCAFYNTALTKVHDVELVENAKASFPVGAFMGNSFYFFDDSGDGSLKKTEFDTDRYKFSSVPVKGLLASEAVNYGYNMLDSDPYTFNDGTTATPFEMNGILPYDNPFVDSNSDDEWDEPVPNLIMQPRANSRIWFRCNYDVSSSDSYVIVWSWKEVSADEWTVFNTDWDIDNLFNSADSPVLQASLIVPAKEILIRCEAYNSDDLTVVEKAMTVGFDFTLDADSTTLNTQPLTYDLSTATGMTSWKNRLVVWGVPQDPTILFISDLDEPGYFPYPNNITIFDEPIIAVTELMDSLIVFTTNKVHQVVLNNDGFTWSSTVIQSNLYIESWDKHLIQPVRNMIYFKSGNYYYMLVPKAQSTTGELTLAPITTPITDFFNHFKANVTQLFKDCYKTIDEQGEVVQLYPENLLTYYNFIDYEDIHNFYVYQYNDVFVHLDIIYNTVDRYWKINVYESAQFLYPFRNDATQNGLFAITNVMHVVDEDSSEEGYKRFIQILQFNKLEVQDFYIVSDSTFSYSTSHIDSYIEDEDVVIPESISSYDNEVLTLVNDAVSMRDLQNEILHILNSINWISGFSIDALEDSLITSKELLKSSIIFANRQMLDTGYRDANLFINKRYRELQLQINNLDNVDMEFGMDFSIAGEPRNTDFLYEASQMIDELTQDEGIVYLDATPYMPIPYVNDDDQRLGVIDKTNLWTIQHSLDFDISLWKVRAAISGKGPAPRLRLFTKNMFNYQLLSISWVYREMNMR